MLSAKTVDYRVIFIDKSTYIGIPGDERRRALNDLLSDIRMFDQPAFKARVETVVMTQHGTFGNIDRQLIVRTKDKKSVADQLADSEDFAEMQNGTGAYTPEINLAKLRDEVLGYLGHLAGKGAASVDIHIFANGWYTGQLDRDSESLMTMMWPSSCVHDLNKSRERVPENVTLTFEFRAPEDVALPNDAAQAALITMVAGWAVGKENILTRKAAGPHCPPIDGKEATPYTAANGPDICDRPDANADSGRYKSCGGVLQDAVGAVTREPVSLVASGAVPSLQSIGTTGTAAQGIDLSLVLNTLSVPAAPGGGQSRVTGVLAPGDYDPWLSLSSGGSCQSGSSITLLVESEKGPMIQLSTGPVSCTKDEMRLQLATVQVQ